MCVCGVCTAVHTYTRRDAHMIETINVFIHTLSVGLEKNEIWFTIRCHVYLIDCVWTWHCVVMLQGTRPSWVGSSVRLVQSYSPMPPSPPTSPSVTTTRPGPSVSKVSHSQSHTRIIHTCFFFNSPWTNLYALHSPVPGLLLTALVSVNTLLRWKKTDFQK